MSSKRGANSKKDVSSESPSATWEKIRALLLEATSTKTDDKLTIPKLRGEIDLVTRDILILTKMRIILAQKIGSIKRTNGDGITDQAREEEVIKKARALCREIGLDEETGIKVVSVLIEESKKAQNEIS